MSEPLTDTGESTSFQIQSDAGNVATIESFAITPKENAVPLENNNKCPLNAQ